jgi:hypothetical protein
MWSGTSVPANRTAAYVEPELQFRRDTIAQHISALTIFKHGARGTVAGMRLA